MRRSLTAKLILAFVFVSLTGLALALGTANWLTVREFRQLAFEEGRNRFVSDMAYYYQTHGSWSGVLEDFSSHGRPKPPPLSSSGGGSASALPPSYFVLADSAGRVLIPAMNYKQGDQIPAEKLAAGVAVTVNDARVGTVLVEGSAPPLAPTEEQFLSRINAALLFSAGGAAAIALALGVLLARRLTRPLVGLTAALRAVADGHMKQRVPVDSQDELGVLATAFNKMSEDLNRLTESRRQMTADVAHDLRTPLTVISGYIESMRDGVLKPTQERLGLIQTEVNHLQRLIEDLRTLTLADSEKLSLNREPIGVAGLLNGLAQSYRPLAEKHGVALKTYIGAGVSNVFVDPDRLTQVISNCVTNSFRYTPAGGEVSLRACQDGTDVVLTIQDSGKGIPPSALPYIFDRFYRADAARSQGEESGLGLAIAKSIVEAHGGTISAESELGIGTGILIRLPAR